MTFAFVIIAKIHNCVKLCNTADKAHIATILKYFEQNFIRIKLTSVEISPLGRLYIICTKPPKRHANKHFATKISSASGSENHMMQSTIKTLPKPSFAPGINSGGSKLSTKNAINANAVKRASLENLLEFIFTFSPHHRRRNFSAEFNNKIMRYANNTALR